MQTMRERIVRRLAREAEGFSRPVALYVESEARERWEKANPGGDPYCDTNKDWALESWLILVDAVLDEMREPDEGMIDAAHLLAEDEIISPIHDKLALLNAEGPVIIWRAMIDHAKLANRRI